MRRVSKQRAWEAGMEPRESSEKGVIPPRAAARSGGWSSSGRGRPSPRSARLAQGGREQAGRGQCPCWGVAWCGVGCGRPSRVEKRDLVTGLTGIRAQEG